MGHAELRRWPPPTMYQMHDTILCQTVTLVATKHVIFTHRFFIL